MTAPADRAALVEAMARAMRGGWVSVTGDPEMDRWRSLARAALAAIEARGAVVVPRVATQAMVDVLGYAGRDNEMRGIHWLMTDASPFAPERAAVRAIIEQETTHDR